MLVVCSLCVLSLPMKLFLVVGLMAVFEHIVLTIVNYFGKLKMLIKVVSLQSVSQIVVNLFVLVAWKVISESGKLDHVN